MEIKFKEPVYRIKSMLPVALLALVGGIAAALFAQAGILFIPLVAAPLALIYLVERGRRPVFTVTVSLLLLTIDVVLNGFYSFSVLSAVLVAVILAVSLKTGFFAKGEAVMASVIIVSLLSLLSLLMLGCYLSGELDFIAALEYYKNAVVEGEMQWQSAVQQYTLSASDPELVETMTPEVVSALYRSYVNGIYSLVAIIVFLSVGATCKLLSRLVYRRAENDCEIHTWRFTLTPVYAYFYLALYTLQMLGIGDDAFSIALTNVLNLLMIVFAYLGLVFVDAFLRMRSGGRGYNKFLVFAVLILLFSLAVNILSFAGVVAVIMLDRAKKEGFGDGNNLGT